MSFVASGWYLVPIHANAQENVTSIAQGTKSWRTKRSWGWLDGLLILGNPLGLNVIGGFRWDSYSLRFRDLSLGLGASVDEIELTVNSYLPLIGTQYSCGNPGNGLLLRIVGFPHLPGSARYTETLGVKAALGGLVLSGAYSLAENWTFDSSSTVHHY